MFIITVYLISVFKIIFNSYNLTIFIHSTFLFAPLSMISLKETIYRFSVLD